MYRHFHLMARTSAMENDRVVLGRPPKMDTPIVSWFTHLTKEYIMKACPEILYAFRFKSFK